MSHTLDGTNIVVTRPAHQAEPLCKLIEQQGGEAIRFPVLDIAEPHDTNTPRKIIERLAEFDMAIFISPNAVDSALAMINATGGIPAQLKVAAVGQGSHRTLTNHGVTVDFFPQQQFNSEALLAMDELQQVAGKKIVIFRGEGGRELLANALKERGASVEYAECYRRTQPNTDTEILAQKRASGELDIIVVTSSEGLQNLYDMTYLTGQEWVLDLPLLLVSQRTATLAAELGFTQAPILATKASDEAIMQALTQWRMTKNN